MPRKSRPTQAQRPVNLGSSQEAYDAFTHDSISEAPVDDKRKTASTRLGSGGWAIILVLMGFLAAAVAVAFYAWNELAGVEISTDGWIAMGLGLFFTALVGVGLMALIFYSSRRNYDR